jgi:hypothetical protein
MPIGSQSSYRYIMQGVLATNPKSILDLGIGFGMNGCGIRNWYDLGLYPFKTKLVGVEGFEGYRNPAWELYDKVIVGNILEVIDGLEVFDMILITDVIEHFDKQQGVELLNKLKTKVSKCVMVSTPGVWIEQGEYMGNKLEAHKSMWSVKDFTDLGYGIVQDGTIDDMGHMMITADFIKR